MPLSVEDLREHLAYSAWASQRLVHAASELTEAELLRDFETCRPQRARHAGSHLRRRPRMARALAARLLRNTPARPTISSPCCRRNGPNCTASRTNGWTVWTDDAVRADLTYQDMRGRDWTQPVWKLLLHVVNHATHHRGQVSGFLRTMGRVPPVLDLVAFYRLR